MHWYFELEFNEIGNQILQLRTACSKGKWKPVSFSPVIMKVECAADFSIATKMESPGNKFVKEVNIFRMTSFPPIWCSMQVVPMVCDWPHTVPNYETMECECIPGYGMVNPKQQLCCDHCYAGIHESWYTHNCC